MAYVITQNDTAREGSDPRDNLVVFGGARVRIGRGNIGAELVVDDIQIDKADRENTADQLAWRIYGSIPVPLGNASSVTADFTRVDSYTYMRDFYTDVYQQYDKPLGSVLGPGSDRLRLAGETWIGGGIRIGGSVGAWRQGGLRIDQRPARGPNGNAGKPFPAVTPGSTRGAVLLPRGHRGRLRHSPYPRFHTPSAGAQIRNAANVPDAAAPYVRAIVSDPYASPSVTRPEQRDVRARPRAHAGPASHAWLRVRRGAGWHRAACVGARSARAGPAAARAGHPATQRRRASPW
jgi:hypothetical protein